MLQLQARIRAFRSYASNSQVPRNLPSRSSGANIVNESAFAPKQLELPSLPIAKFSGNIWEWDNFWELFESNVHSQDLSELHKFNYLLNALKGEALESVRKFQVTKENYAKALEFLRNKYENSEELVFRLIDKLDGCSLRSTAIRDQRRLFEQVQVIVAQLVQKGENVNNQWLLRRILSKFPDSTQRRKKTSGFGT